jgi:2-dehydropantoate 2-reductase
VGGAIGGRLAEHEHDVVLVARGEHARAMQRDGLTLRAPDSEARVRATVVEHVDAIDPQPGDVVVLSVKSQDTMAAVGQLAVRFPIDTPVVCAQNGVANEAMVLRSFRNVYGMPVMLPSVFLEPGVVEIFCHPLSGHLDLGRYPSGLDDTAVAVSAALRASTFGSVPREDVMPWKWTKLLSNLANAAVAFCGADLRQTELPGILRREALACFEAAGIAWVDEAEYNAHHAVLRHGSIDGRRSPGGSTFQSVARGRDVETEYLNGEVILLGRLHGVPTPANEALQQLMRRELAAGVQPGAMTAADLMRRLGLDG